MEWKWNRDGNKKEVRYGIEKEWNRNGIECRLKFQAKENVAEIQGKLCLLKKIFVISFQTLRRQV